MAGRKGARIRRLRGRSWAIPLFSPGDSLEFDVGKNLAHPPGTQRKICSHSSEWCGRGDPSILLTQKAHCPPLYGRPPPFFLGCLRQMGGSPHRSAEPPEGRPQYPGNQLGQKWSLPVARYQREWEPGPWLSSWEGVFPPLAKHHAEGGLNQMAEKQNLLAHRTVRRVTLCRTQGKQTSKTSGSQRCISGGIGIWFRGKKMRECLHKGGEIDCGDSRERAGC